MSKLIALCPTFERADLVRQLVASYREVAPSPLPPIVFHVQGQDDGTDGWLRHQSELSLPVGILESPAALPFAKAINMAASVPDAREADWLLLLNNDLILRPGFFAALDEMIEHHYDIIGAKLLYPDGRIQHYGGWLTLDSSPFHVLRYQPADHKQAQQPRPYPWVTFACAAIRRSVWDDLHGLDEAYVNGFEDVDFCLRAREAGAQIGVHHLMLATHLESQTTGKDTSNKEAQWQRFSKVWVETSRISWATGVHQGWKNT